MGTGRTRGWRRIGIVLSVLWFIGFGGWIRISGVQHISDFYSWQLKMCYAILGTDNESLQYIKNPDDREKRQAENSAKHKRCEEQASAFFMQQADQNYNGIPILLGIDLATVALGWLVVWFVTL